MRFCWHIPARSRVLYCCITEPTRTQATSLHHGHKSDGNSAETSRTVLLPTDPVSRATQLMMQQSATYITHNNNPSTHSANPIPPQTTSTKQPDDTNSSVFAFCFVCFLSRVQGRSLPLSATWRLWRRSISRTTD